MIETMELYKSSKDFMEYVNKYMVKRDIDLITALSHEMVKEYARYLKHRSVWEGKVSR